jgi:hypothetical protein
MPRFASLALALSALCAGGARAQGTLLVSSNQCDLDKVGQIHRMTDSLWIPIAQEMVNEGKLIAAGSSYHSWGDEWNVVLWYVAKDIPSFLTAFDEMAKRVNQRNPTFIPQVTSWCSRHRDSFYTQGKRLPLLPPRRRRPRDQTSGGETGRLLIRIEKIRCVAVTVASFSGWTPPPRSTP